MVADERTSFPTSSRQEDEFEFVVAPVIELLKVVVRGKVILFIFSSIINDYELVEMFVITK